MKIPFRHKQYMCDVNYLIQIMEGTETLYTFLIKIDKTLIYVDHPNFKRAFKKFCLQKKKKNVQKMSRRC